MKTARQLFKTMLFLLLLSGIAGCSKDSDNSKGGGVDPVPQDNTGVTVTNKATDAWGLSEIEDRSAIGTFINYAFKLEDLKVQAFKVCSDNWEGDLLSGVGPNSDPTRLFDIIRDLSQNYETYKSAATTVLAMTDEPVTRAPGMEGALQAGYDAYTYTNRKAEEINECLKKEKVYDNQKAMNELYDFLPASVKQNTKSAKEWFANFKNGKYNSYANAIRNTWYDAGISSSQKSEYAEKFYEDIDDLYQGKDPRVANMLEVAGIAVTAAASVEIMAIDQLTGGQLGKITDNIDKIDDITEIYKETTKLIDKIQTKTATSDDLKAFGAMLGSKYVQEHFNDLFPKGTSKTIQDIAGTVASMVMKKGVTKLQQKAAEGLGFNIMEVLDNIKSQGGILYSVLRDPQTGKTTIGVPSKDGNVRVILDTQPDGTAKLTVIKNNGYVNQVIDASGKVTTFNAMPDGSNAVLRFSKPSVTFYNWDGESKELKVYSNYEKLTPSTDTDWCSVSLDDYGNLTLVAKANKTGKKRSGTVTVTGSTYDYDTGKEYTSKATLRIEQWEEQQMLLSGSPDKFELKSNAQDKTLTITTNLPYFEVPYDEEYDWITPVRTGSGYTYTIHFDENGGLDKRKGTITIKGWFDQRLAPAMITSIPVTQESASLGEISVTPDSLKFKAEGGMDEITFYTAGYPYYGKDVADDAKDWLTVQFGAGYEDESDKLVGISVSKNTTSVARIGVVTFWVSDVENPTESQKKKVTFTVKQEGVQAASLTVTPTKLDYDGEGGTQTVTITTNQPKITYSMSDEDKSWITVSGTKSAIDFKVEPNPSTEPRTAKVEIRARNENNDIVAKETVTINQKGGTNTASVLDFVKYVRVKFTSTVQYDLHATNGESASNEQWHSRNFNYTIGTIGAETTTNVSCSGNTATVTMTSTAYDDISNKINVPGDFEVNKGISNLTLVIENINDIKNARIKSIEGKGEWSKSYVGDLNQKQEGELKASDIPIKETSSNKWSFIGEKKNGAVISKWVYKETYTPHYYNNPNLTKVKTYTWTGQDDYKIEVYLVDEVPVYSIYATRK